MSKKDLIRVNNIIWFAIAVCLMISAYKAWSLNGPYTLVSFLVSLFIHGGLCYGLNRVFDKIIKAYF